MRTSDVERATEAISTLYNAKSNSDGTLFQLPGSNDPTISIVKVPEDASPAEIGLFVRFSVYNLEKARKVLETEAVSCVENTLEDSSAELVLDHQQAGYATSVCQEPSEELSKDIFTSLSGALRSVRNSTVQINHYASIMPDADQKKFFHEQILSFTHIRTFTVNAGLAPEGQDDG
ncbi:glu leu phe val dehydrogenase family [Fusarium pseudocircinatum]|uniref:Glu leu phe val dehydrogenase family n=1 Tax=Fusarium pseudocircinatum TaxID=56676 RepID=A0A8H5NPF0_9HYPO|nr:glu leu phe val dehydrogenase family [Fusarium pseudocircinatum]